MSRITQAYRAVGAWDISFESIPQELVDQLEELGHVVVTEVREQGPSLGDALLDVARYVGVVRGHRRGPDDAMVTLSGPGLEWWLGTEDKVGAVYETAKTYTANTLSTVIADLLPASITAGTLTNTGLPTYTGTHQWITPREAIDYVCDTVGATWRVRPNGTLDAGPQASVFASGRALIVRRAEDAGDDMTVRAFPGPAQTDRDVEDFTTRVVVLGKVEDDTVVQGDWDIAGGLNPYKDLHGNTVDLTRIVSESSTEGVNATARAEAIGEQYQTPQRAITLDTSDYDFRGAIEVGDMVWVYDPDAGLLDANNEVQFRGQRLNPVSEQVTSMTWPVISGMGVYYRSRLGAWIDLSRYLVASSDATTVEVGKNTRELVSSGEVPTGRVPEPDTSIPGVPVFTTPFSQSLYQQGDTGVSRAQVQVKWASVVFNTDGSPVVDLSHYEIGYRPSTSPLYPATYAQAAAAGTWGSLGTWGQPVAQSFTDWSTAFAPGDATTALISELSPGSPYEYRIRALDSATPPNAGAWSSTWTQYTPVDVIAPNTPAAPVVAGSKIAVLVKHFLGDDNGGTFNLAQDLAGLRVDIGTTSTFTVDRRPIGEGGTFAGRIIATKAHLLGQIPVVATFPVDTTSPLWVRVTAYDEAGNESQPSAAAAVTAQLIDNQWISDLTVDKLTSGTMTASVILGGEIATAPSGQRVRFGFDGLEAYLADGVTKILDVDIASQTLTAAGLLQSAVSGKRWVLNPDTTLRFVHIGGDYSQFTAYDTWDGSAVSWRAPLDVNNMSGRVSVTSIGVNIGFSPESDFTALRSEILLRKQDVGLTSPLIRFFADKRYTANPAIGGGQRISFAFLDGSGNQINDSLLYFQTAPSDQPWLAAPFTNSGLAFDFNALVCQDGGRNAIPIGASAFNNISTRAAKFDEADLPFDPLAAVRAAPAKSWRYLDDAKPRPERPDGGEHYRERPAKWSREQPPAQLHFGPMAEDLAEVHPALVTEMAGRPATDVRDLLGVLWAAVRKLDVQVEGLKGTKR